MRETGVKRTGERAVSANAVLLRRWMLAALAAGMLFLELIVAFSFSAISAARAETVKKNEVEGIWRIVSAELTDTNGQVNQPYGPEPKGRLVFTREMEFVAVLLDPRVPDFASDIRGEGTAAENAAAMAGSIGFFGTYTVDENGVFSGNTVLGSTFPNWEGSVRTTEQLQLRVEGDRMIESFSRPSGLRIAIEWERVR
ncbi:lipocalin-like domain-containing protein [Thalassospira australica]|uniref:lipocalin-like domain-containing protein n=1 Tax=Thalassospira australica TaxID=1528106 RepID=UPI00384FABDE